MHQPSGHDLIRLTKLKSIFTIVICINNAISRQRYAKP